MKLIIYAIVFLLIALLVPPALPHAPAVILFLVSYASGMCLYAIGYGRLMSLPGFKQWNAP